MVSNDSAEERSVSIIIPFKNNPEELTALLRSILSQGKPSGLEIFCIDNGSDRPVDLPDDLKKQITLPKETKHPNSPYSARNRGIEASTGDVIVFVDANSVVADGWLLNGLTSLRNSGADLLAGAVAFDFGGKRTGAKLADSISGIRMEEAVKERGCAYTANLFVRRELFNKIGLFEEGIRSGGDVAWTLRATQSGSRLIYEPEALVLKRARSARDYYRKKIRTGRGYYHNWKKQPKEERVSGTYNLLRAFKPRLPQSDDLTESERIKAGFHVWAGGILSQLAFIWEKMRGG